MVYLFLHEVQLPIPSHGIALFVSLPSGPVGSLIDSGHRSDPVGVTITKLVSAGNAMRILSNLN